MIIKPITLTITSCNRVDLLEKTINSFFKLNTYPIDEFILSDDSNSDEINENIKKIFGEKFKIIKNEQRVGLSKSLDNLFSQSKNEYIFHCEDDWLFDGNPNFISDSLEILIENINIHQVSVRHQYDNPHKFIGNKLKTKKSIQSALVGINSVSVGFAIAAFFIMLQTTNGNALQLMIVAFTFVLLKFTKTPPALIILLGLITAALQA
jgi:hypothetical protein